MRATFGIAVVALLALTTLGRAQASKWYASSVYASSNLGAAPYDNPVAALGKPTTWVADSVNGGPSMRVAASLVYAPFGTSPEGQNLLCTVRSGGQLVVAFDPPVFDDPRNWYGRDFICFGNSFLASNQTVMFDTNMGSVTIGSSGDFVELGTVSVSPDGIQWYTYPVSNTQAVDAYWPTQAFRWSTTSGTWGPESDFTKPVPPTLTRSWMSGKSAAQVIAAFDGSGGGCAFDLKPSGFPFIRYVRFTGASIEVDAVSRVSWARTARTLTATVDADTITRLP